MGSCCSSSNKTIDVESSSSLEPLKKGSQLYLAQLMTKTKNGKPIIKAILKKAISQMEAEKSANDPNVSEDMRMVFSHPFNVCNKLTKFVYLSGIASLNKETLEKFDINLIINATYEWPKVCPIIHGKEVVNIRVPVDDSGLDDISIYFDEVSDKIEENANKGGHTLVHCMAGASRSTTLVLAYLMKYENISLVNAFKSVKKRRETGRPNIGFWDQLIKYEIKIRGKASTRMTKHKENGFEVNYPDFYKTIFPDLYKWEVEKQVKEAKDKLKNPEMKTKGEKIYDFNTNSYK